MSSDAERLKREAARAALEFVVPGEVIGVGTGSTTNHFIDLLAGLDEASAPAAALASSEVTARRLREGGLRVVEANDVEALALYVDGADETTARGELIKGGGGALTREKVLAQAARRFVCIVDESKQVERLGAFPLPVEVIPMAERIVARAIAELGGTAKPREGFVTDNGNRILDVTGLDLSEPRRVESRLDHLAGAVTNGLFCRRRADVLLIGKPGGVRRVETPSDAV